MIPGQLYAAQDPLFDFDAFIDEPAFMNLRRLQHNGNVDDMSIPHMLMKTRMRQTRTSTTSLLTHHPILRVLGGAPAS